MDASQGTRKGLVEAIGSNKHFNVSPIVGIEASASQALGQGPNNFSFPDTSLNELFYKTIV